MTSEPRPRAAEGSHPEGHAVGDHELRQPVVRYDAKIDAGAGAEVALLKGVGLTREFRVFEWAQGPGSFTVGVRQRAVGLVYDFLRQRRRTGSRRGVPPGSSSR